MMIVALIALLLLPAFAQATDYWVATNGNNGVSCSTAQSSSTPKLTIQAGIDCMVGGDTLILKAGTYNNQQITDPPAGTASAYTVIKGDPSGARPLLNPNADGNNTRRGVYCTRGETCKYIEIQYLEITNGYNGLKMDGSDANGYAHHWRILNNYFRQNRSTDILTNTSPTGYLGGDHLIQGNEFDRTGYHNPGYGPGHNTIYNPGNRSIVERNTFHNLTHGVGIWTSNKLIQNVIVRYNLFYDVGLYDVDTYMVGSTSTKIIHVSTGGGGHEIYGNVIYDSCDRSTCDAILVHPYSYASQTQTIKIYNNTIYNHQHASAKGIRYSAQISPGAVEIRNNIVYLAGGIITTGMTNFVSENNRTTDPSFTNAATGDLSLASGSGALNAGTTATALPYCGSAPAQGALEELVVTAASIDGNLMDVTICNASPPIIPGTFTVGCTGTGCGTPTVTGTSLLGGAGGIVRLQTSVTCDDSQTWTVSAGTTTTDSTLVGNTLSQPLHTVTNFPVNSSACDGTGGPSAPAAEEAHYLFDGDLTDASGNGNTITASNTSFTTGRTGQGVLTTAGVNSYLDTGILSGHNPSTSHLVVSTWVYIDPSNLGQTKDIWGTALTGSDRFFLYRSSTNVWRMGIGATSGGVSEFPVASGWTHCCVKMHPTGDVATLYINGEAGTTSGASVISGYGSYVLASDLRFGLPSGFATSLSGAHIYEEAYVYTSDVSCPDLYAAGQPATGASMATQVGHRWHGVYLTSAGAVENRGAANDQRTVVKGGAVALMVQVNNETGGTLSLQPRFRYNINGGDFVNVVPDSPTADGVSYWGGSLPVGINNGIADGPISGALTHTDGITMTNSTSVPTLSMADDTSYTPRGIFNIDAAIGDVVCFKIYDQGGSALASYDPAAGACVTVIAGKSEGAQ